MNGFLFVKPSASKLNKRILKTARPIDYFRKQLLIWGCLLGLASSCAPVLTRNMQVETGKASYYANKFEGRKTASGQIYRHRKMTAAHRSLPFGTEVKVTNLQNGKSVKVEINDRGPFVAGRIIDVSQKAAKKLEMVHQGVVSVEIRYPRK